MRVGVVGINHKLADLKLRESLAKCCQRRFSAGNSLHGDHSFILLSTCNRTEIYFTSNHLPDTHSYLLKILRQEVEEEFDHKLYSYFGRDCFFHLSRVTAGLDSAVIAETEIQGQVKTAYETTIPYTSLKADLHFLFQKSLKIGKQVRSELFLGKSMPSLEYAIFQIGRHMFKQAEQVKILFVGASEINLKIIQDFYLKGLKDLTICNRSIEHAKEVAERFQLQMLPWEEWSRCLNYDWIIFGTKSPHFLLTREDFHSCVKNKLIMDLSVPRNVEPQVARQKGVTLLNIDQINRTLKIRKKQMHHLLGMAEQMVVESTQKHLSLFQEKERNRQIYFVESSRCM